MKEQKTGSSSRSFTSSRSTYDIDALTSLVTEEKKTSSQRAPSARFHNRRVTLTKEDNGQKTVAIAPVEYLPQEWAEKLYPRLNPTAEKESRKVYIGGLGASTTDADVTRFLQSELKDQSICSPEEMITNIEMRNDSERKYRFCFVEFSHAELAEMVMSLHEREFTNSDGKTTFIKVGRTKDFPGAASKEKISRMVFVDGIPIESVERETLLSMFSDEEIGKVKNLWVLREHDTLLPKGSVLVQYESVDAVEKLITALQGVEYEGASLVVREATQEDRFQVVKQKTLTISEGLLYFLTCEDAPRAFTSGALNDFTKEFDPALIFAPEQAQLNSLVVLQSNATDQLFSDVLTSTDGRGVDNVIQTYYKHRKLSPPTRILVLLNMVEENELEDDETFENLKEDMEEELERYGLLQELIITRFPPMAPSKMPNAPLNGDKKSDHRWIEYERQMNEFHRNLAHPVLGFVGRIFAVYSSVQDAMNAQKNISGRKFNGRTVITSFIAERFINPETTDHVTHRPIDTEKRLTIL
ncbi:U2AF65-like splicing factor [Perkinsela sp. CCAP 1560/4]|nr:U2AF65-like splicing factor [Perkinsela sp. CCAP 1560/4]|eukprot:KNH08753.1 U2AF65-like splicing factor [Perkinsela sp. CCAP 1560/4]